MQNTLSFLPKEVKSIYFSGILGVSMSSLALISKQKDYRVAGSDTGENQRTEEKLKASGIKINKDHTGNNLNGFDVFVYTAAVGDKNPEIKYAKSNKMQIFTRAEFLGGLISEYQNKIGIAGTHGKSTVSGMLTNIYVSANKNITALIGAESVSLGSCFVLGSGTDVIYEACEYKRSFLDLKPSCAVILNIEKEHTDCYNDVSDAIEAYREFASECKTCVLNYDDENVLKLMSNQIKKTVSSQSEILISNQNKNLISNQNKNLISSEIKKAVSNQINRIYFSLNNENADVYAKNIECQNGFYSFDTVFRGKEIFSVKLSVPGLHNVKNALAAISTAISLGIEPYFIKQGISEFKGMKRRFEYIGDFGGAKVYDDYAHHPTEIKAALEGAKKMGFKKIICAFQPHTYSRTAEFFTEFTRAFENADEVIFADIFAAREKNIFGVSSEALAKATPRSVYISSAEELTEYLKGKAEDGALILTMGAGKLDKIAESIVRKN